MKYGENLQSLYWEMKNRPMEEHSTVDVAAREAAQSLVAAEMGRIREQEQLGHIERRLAGMGWKRRIEWAVKRRLRRAHGVSSEKGRSGEVSCECCADV